jgi:hypothetical protein
MWGDGQGAARAAFPPAGRTTTKDIPSLHALDVL